ncbi:MAG: hypothetical protein M1837_002092 [Sclerophora amabilis]|nr:MAG: hypothetical protein M1837_002092 [Sclerophora amabilis]
MSSIDSLTNPVKEETSASKAPIVAGAAESVGQASVASLSLAQVPTTSHPIMSPRNDPRLSFLSLAHNPPTRAAMSVEVPSNETKPPVVAPADGLSPGGSPNELERTSHRFLELVPRK